MTNEITTLLQDHRSIRKYTDQDISEEILQDIIKSAQSAHTSHYIQGYSIIVIRDQKKKEKLEALCGEQTYVRNCPVFLVFCADFYRLQLTTEMHENYFAIDEIENVIVGSVDATLAAQNAYIAAKSYGLGGVMIGGIRNEPAEVASLLNLPRYVFPVMGLCLGYPAEKPGLKPRLPQITIAHSESYQTEHLQEELKKYNEITAEYYTKRTNGKVTDGWVKKMSDYLSEPRRKELKKFIVNQGFKAK